MRTLSFTLMIVGVLVTSGCQTFDWKKLQQPKWPWLKAKSNAEREKKGQYEEPHRMVAIWTDTVRYSSGGQPTRGFGGRLYFYNDHGQAIPVEGQLAVYAYDDTLGEGGQDPNRPPDRRYAFTKEQFTQHFSKSDLGASYSVWIPWDAAGGERRQLTLMPVFTSVDGRVLVGQQSASVLPGHAPPEEVLPAQGVAQSGVYDGQAVAYEKAIQRNQAMQTTTISVPRHGAIRSLQRPNPMTNLPVTQHGTPAAQTPPWQPQESRAPAWDQSNRLPAVSPEPQAPESVPRFSTGQASPPTRFERPRSRVLGAPIAQLGPDRLPTQPPLATRPFSPPWSPPQGQ